MGHTLDDHYVKKLLIQQQNIHKSNVEIVMLGTIEIKADIIVSNFPT